MTKMYDIGNSKELNVGNSYTYTVLDADKLAYSGFFLTAASTVEISNGVDTIDLTLAANEEVLLNSETTTIIDTITNNIVWLY